MQARRTEVITLKLLYAFVSNGKQVYKMPITSVRTQSAILEKDIFMSIRYLISLLLLDYFRETNTINYFAYFVRLSRIRSVHSITVLVNDFAHLSWIFLLFHIDYCLLLDVL